jgi:hypothetical protein
LTRQQFVDIAAAVSKPVFKAKEFSSVSPNIANGREVDILWMFGFVASKRDGVTDLRVFAATDQPKANHRNS